MVHIHIILGVHSAYIYVCLYIYIDIYKCICRCICIYRGVFADKETTTKTQILTPVHKDLADTVKRLRHATRSAGELLAQANQFHRPEGKMGVVPKIMVPFWHP